MSTTNFSAAYTFGYTPNLGVYEFPDYFNNMEPNTCELNEFITRTSASVNKERVPYADEYPTLDFIIQRGKLSLLSETEIIKQEYRIALSGITTNDIIENYLVYDKNNNFDSNNAYYVYENVDKNVLSAKVITSINTYLNQENNLYFDNGVLNCVAVPSSNSAISINGKSSNDVVDSNGTLRDKLYGYKTYIKLMKDPEDNNWKIKTDNCELILEPWTKGSYYEFSNGIVNPIVSNEKYTMSIAPTNYNNFFYARTDLGRYNLCIDNYLVSAKLEQLDINYDEYPDIISSYTGAWIRQYTDEYIENYNTVNHKNYNKYTFSGTSLYLRTIGNPLFKIVEQSLIGAPPLEDFEQTLVPYQEISRTRVDSPTFIFSYYKDIINEEGEEETIISSFYSSSAYYARLLDDVKQYTNITSLYEPISFEGINLPSGMYINMFTNEAKTGIYHCSELNLFDLDGIRGMYYTTPINIIYPKDEWTNLYPDNDNGQKHIDEYVFNWIPFNLTTDNNTEEHPPMILKLFGWTKYSYCDLFNIINKNDYYSVTKLPMYEIIVQSIGAFELEEIKDNE